VFDLRWYRLSCKHQRNLYDEGKPPVEDKVMFCFVCNKVRDVVEVVEE
jgi:hypothetical protein